MQHEHTINASSCLKVDLVTWNTWNCRGKWHKTHRCQQQAAYQAQRYNKMFHRFSGHQAVVGGIIRDWTLTRMRIETDQVADRRFRGQREVLAADAAEAGAPAPTEPP